MIVDMIILGIAKIIGLELVICMLLFWTFIIAALSRGLGMISLLITYILFIWLFMTYPMSYLTETLIIIPQQLAVVSFMLLGLLVGFIFYQTFLRQ
jgi:hypothetical protein